MQNLKRWVSGTVSRQIEPWRMRIRMGRLRKPRPSREALVQCWRAIRHAAAREPRQAVSVPLGTYTLHGHNAADLLDVFYEIFISEAYDVTLGSERPFIIDCGANVGIASVYFKLHFPGSRLIAFEPNPSCVAMWQENVIGNGFTGAELVQAAVGAADGTLDLFLADDRTLGSSTVHKSVEAGRATPVKVVPLSRWIDGPVDVLKIDVEGAEGTVLEELSSSGALPNVRRLMIEYHHRLGGAPCDLSRFLAILEQHGFTYKILSPDRGGHFDNRWQCVMIYAINPAEA